MNNEGLNKVLQDWAKVTQQKLDKNLSWTSNLKDNVKVIVVEGDVVLQMPDYGVFVEFGRKPGKQPPLNVIYAWCKSKNIPIKAAFPIARKIGKKGLKAHPFIHEFTDGLDQLASDIGDYIVDEIIEDIEKLENNPNIEVN